MRDDRRAFRFHPLNEVFRGLFAPVIFVLLGLTASCDETGTDECRISTDCQIGKVCRGHSCVKAVCETVWDCLGGEVCTHDIGDANTAHLRCSAPCSNEYPCEAPLTCVYGECVKGTSDCTQSEDCVFGEVCGADFVCSVVTCYGKGDCNTGEVCVPGEIVGKEAGMKYCSAPCSETKPCTAASTSCVDGLCVSGDTLRDVIEDSSSGDVGENDVPDTFVDKDSAVDEDAGEDAWTIESGVDCKVCTLSTDCGTGYTCQPIGAEKHCLRDCNDDGDCLSGYTCYHSGTQKSCLPVSYNCVACTFDTPCDAGKCCDILNGSCKECRDECFTCTYDFDCGPGLRCYKEIGNATGVCVPECANGICKDTAHYQCGDNGKGVKLCTPTTDGCKGCSGDTPIPLGGGCVQCRSDDDCDDNEKCNTNDHACAISSCSGDNILCDDMTCHQCCVDDDCLKYPEATGLCKEDGTCEGVTSCGGLCTDDFPVCAVVQSAEQCVQCATDSDCAMINSGCTCVGDPLYACVDEYGAICVSEGGCSATCEDSGDCPPTSTGGAMECALISGGTSGFCYDPTGTCDGSSSCCAPGKKCYDISLLIMSGKLGDTSQVDHSTFLGGAGYCECSTTDDCVNGKSCTDMTIICTLGSLLGSLAAFVDLICPGGQLNPSMPQKMCLELADLLGGIL